MTTTDEVSETRHRLLEAAGEVFEEHGFRHATVRDICKRADANVAAVNYHFGDKEKLYVAVLRQWSDEAMNKYPPTLGLGSNHAAEQRLESFVRSFLFRVLDEGRPAWHGKLVAREMADPTPVFDSLAETVCRPLYSLLLDIVRDLLGQNATAETVRLCAGSIVGQCLFHHHCRPLNAKLMPEIKLDAAGLDPLARHITRFSLHAIHTLRSER